MGIYAEKLPQAMAEQLRAERAASGLTYKQLASATDLHEQTLMKYLKGLRDIPTTAVIAMAEAFDISPAELMRRAVERIEK